jgi:hypothetical protein
MAEEAVTDVSVTGLAVSFAHAAAGVTPTTRNTPVVWSGVHTGRSTPFPTTVRR